MVIHSPGRFKEPRGTGRIKEDRTGISEVEVKNRLQDSFRRA